MKKIFSVIFFLVVFQSSCSQAQWHRLPNVSTADYIWFVSADSGYAFFPPEGESYYRYNLTTNGGGTWTPIYPSAEQPTPTAVQYTDLQHFWSDHYDPIWQTRDGGGTWVELHIDPSVIPSRSLFFVADQRHFFVGGQFFSIGRSDDGGASWIRAHIEDTTSSKGSEYFVNYIGFADDTLGIAIAGDNRSGFVLRSTDGGLNWTNSSSPPLYYPTLPHRVNGFEFVDAQHAWALFQNALLFSSDAGQTWSDMHLPTADYYTAITFADARHGLIGGYDSLTKAAMFLHTADGGLSWDKQLIEGFELKLVWPPDILLSYPDSSTAYAIIQRAPYKFSASRSVQTSPITGTGVTVLWSSESVRIQGLTPSAEKLHIIGYDVLGRERFCREVESNPDMTLTLGSEISQPLFLEVISDGTRMFLH